ncbi:hypothetical protein ACEN19_10090 [Corynebacterium auriscanis]|uniref:hypothetical protein n=1 Tax=Corynebacterium auriscanis TaxID=99807 RepID=UPI003CEED8AB
MANPVVTLLADGGDITIGRRVSSFIYGVVNVTAAEGVDTPDDDTGLEQGYICRADGDVPRGRFDFNFARHDAQMRMATEGGDGSSDMEQGIVAASRRSSGDVFFERDIESAGFGRWVPGRDFNVGDTVGVRLWGRTIPLPVTSLSLRNGRWVAHVGGQMIHDAEKLKSQNQSIEKTIADERRRQRKETKAIAGSVLVAQVTADSAKQGAEQAQVTAAKASDETQHLRGILSGEGASPGDVTAQLAVLAEQLEEHGEASPGGLIPAYIAANTRRWELQEYVDQLQDWQIKTLAASVEWHQILAPFTFAVSHTATVTRGFVTVVADDLSNSLTGNMRITNNSDWIDAIVSVGYWQAALVGYSSFNVREFTLKQGQTVDVGKSGYINVQSASDFFISINPQPTKAFSPPAPPKPPQWLKKEEN